MKLRSIILSLLLLIIAPAVCGTNMASKLHKKLKDAIGYDNIGVAVITSQGDVVQVNGDAYFPLQSVMKFHQAIALGRKVGYPAIVNDSVHVEPTDLLSGTWSPMRSQNREGGWYTLPSLLAYSLLLSDNNAADIIFDRYISPAQVDSIVRHTTPARDFAIVHNEAEMNADPLLSLENYSTPLDCARLFDYVFNTDSTEALGVIKDILAEGTRTGTSRLPAGIPNDKGMIFHKTGTGFGAINDAGVVYYELPDGNYASYTIAVFTYGFEDPIEAEKRIAEISAIVWQEHILTALNNVAERVVLPTTTRNRNVPEPERPNFLASLGGALAGAILEEAFERAIESGIDSIIK